MKKRSTELHSHGILQPCIRQPVPVLSEVGLALRASAVPGQLTQSRSHLSLRDASVSAPGPRTYLTLFFFSHFASFQLQPLWYLPYCQKAESLAYHFY